MVRCCGKVVLLWVSGRTGFVSFLSCAVLLACDPLFFPSRSPHLAGKKVFAWRYCGRASLVEASQLCASA